MSFGGNYQDAPPVSAPVEVRAQWWARRGERGMSSNTIFGVFTSKYVETATIPYDPADFRRCRLLLDLFPEWRTNLQRVVDVYPFWKPLVDRWDMMDELYNEELPSGNAPKLYAVLQEARKESGVL